MKLLTGIFLLLLCWSSASAQADKQVLEEKLNDYIRLTKAKDFAGVMEYIHPKLFEMAPKEMIIEAMEKVYSDPMQEMNFDDFSIAGISNVIKDKNVDYALVNYTYKLQLHLTEAFFENEEEEEEDEEEEGDEGDDEEEEGEEDTVDAKSEVMQFMLTFFEERFGKERVRLDDATNTFHIDAASEMFAILDPAIGDWKFIENKEQYEAILNKIVPAKVRKKLKP